jgi:hypothetical protein
MIGFAQAHIDGSVITKMLRRSGNTWLQADALTHRPSQRLSETILALFALLGPLFCELAASNVRFWPFFLFGIFSIFSVSF